MSDLRVLTLFNSLPSDLQKEAADFIEFLKEKSQKRNRSKERKSGLAKGLIEMKPDFDEPLDDFQDYME